MKPSHSPGHELDDDPPGRIRVIAVVDLLCPWSYALVPTIDLALASVPAARVEVVHGRLFGGERRATIDEVQWLRPTAGSITGLTGTTFGEGFERTVTDGERVLDSDTAAVGFVTLRSIAPDYSLDIAAALHREWFVEGRSPAEIDTVLDVATQLGISRRRTQLLFTGPLVRAIVAREARATEQLGVRSHPALFVAADEVVEVPVRLRSATDIATAIIAAASGTSPVVDPPDDRPAGHV